jgi:hypothetical protein
MKEILTVNPKIRDSNKQETAIITLQKTGNKAD